MGDLSGWMNLVWSDLFAAWLMAAIFWAVAGMAAASWAGMSRTLGGVVGAGTLFLGTIGIVVFGLANRPRAMSPAVLDHRSERDDSGASNLPGRAGSGFAADSLGHPGLGPAGFGDPGYGQTANSDTGFGATGFGATGFGATGFGATGFGDPGFGQGAHGDMGSGATGGFGGFGEPGFGHTSAGETRFNQPELAATGSPLGIGRSDRVPLHRSTTPSIIWLSIAGAVVAGFAAALFAPWLTLGFGVELDGSEVALVPLLCTLLAIGVAVGLSWRGPRRLPALVVAWFSSWWLLIGIIGLTSGGRLADLITSAGNDAVTRFSLEKELAGYPSVTVGLGVTLISLAGLLGLSWGAVAVLRCSNDSPRWSG